MIHPHFVMVEVDATEGLENKDKGKRIKEKKVCEFLSYENLTHIIPAVHKLQLLFLLHDHF